jgi:hypothetical protein
LRVPEQRAAQYTRNFGFYRSFLASGEQRAEFSYRNSQWDIGVYDPSATVSLIINMRSLGVGIFQRLSEGMMTTDNTGPSEAFLQFQNYYRCLRERDRLPVGTAPIFEIDIAPTEAAARDEKGRR